jgi:hypothetical protein
MNLSTVGVFEFMRSRLPFLGKDSGHMSSGFAHLSALAFPGEPVLARFCYYRRQFRRWIALSLSYTSVGNAEVGKWSKLAPD